MKNYVMRFFSQVAIASLVFLMQIYLYSQPITVGIKGGISIPELKGGNTPASTGYSSRLALNFGAFINYKLSSHFSLQSEVMFSGQGGKKNGMQELSSSNTGFPIPSDLSLYANFNNETIINYLEIPVLARYTITDGRSPFSEYINAGPYLGVLLNAKTKTSGTSSIYYDKAGTIPVTIQGNPIPPQDFNLETDNYSDVKKLNFGITGGIGVIFNTSAGLFDLDLRGAYGLIPIETDTSNGSNNTGALYLTIGYGLKI